SASGARAAEVVDLFRSYRRAAKHWTDDHDAVELAVEAVRAPDPVLDEVGTVVVYLPRRLGAADLSLLAATGRPHRDGAGDTPRRCPPRRARGRARVRLRRPARRRRGRPSSVSRRGDTTGTGRPLPRHVRPKPT